MRILGINAVFHDSSAALVVDGRIVAAAEEERFSRRKHGKPCVPFSTWELPEQAAAWCLKTAGLRPDQIDAVGYSYDPQLAPDATGDLAADAWEGLRTMYVRNAPDAIATMLPGLPATRVQFVPHHVAHAASAYLAGPFRDCAVMVLDGRGERASYLAGRVRNGDLETLATQPLPHSLGLRYEELTMHCGFARSSDEYKVMALASYGTPRYARELREAWQVDGLQFSAESIDFGRFVAPRERGGSMTQAHADLASSVQNRLQEMLLELATSLHARTGDEYLVLAGGIALNCVANAHIARHGPYREVWVQPAAGDSGTSLGAALALAHGAGDATVPMETAALGRGWTDAELEGLLEQASVDFVRPHDVAEAAAAALAGDGIVAWFQGRSEFGPRALGQRSLLAHPGRAENVARLNEVKGREDFRPVAPMVLASRAAEIFDGQLPSPYMLFTHRVRDDWRTRIPAVVHVDGTARVQTVDEERQPLTARLLRAFEARTGLPVLVNTSLNTAGRPMVDDPRDALECFGSAPIDLLAIGPFALERARSTRRTLVDANVA